jgi:ethanolamine permease
MTTQLQKSLGPWLIWGLGVGYVISGMYFGWNLGLPVGGPYGMLVATIAVTVFYVAFVLGYAELACALPRAGGAFVYASRAFGAHVGFVVGIAQVVEYVLAPPAIAFAIGAYINQAAPGVPVMVGAVASYLVFTAINIVGVRLSAGFELVLSVLAMLELCVFGAVVLPRFSWSTFAHDALPHGWAGGFAALPYAIWFYLAIEGIANIAEEAKRPQRDLPIGFLSAMATLVALTAIVLLGAVGAAGWRSVVYLPDGTSSDSPLPLAISYVVSRDSPWFIALVGIGLVGLVASFHGILIAASRAMLELGRAGFAPRALGAIAPRTNTPVVALLANCAVGLALLVVADTGSVLLLSVFGALTLYLASSIAVIVLRVREPALARPYRTPLYPVTPILALALALVCAGSVLWSYPRIALVYAAILGVAWLGFVVFVPAERRTHRSG